MSNFNYDFPVGGVGLYLNAAPTQHKIGELLDELEEELERYFDNIDLQSAAQGSMKGLELCGMEQTIPIVWPKWRIFAGLHIAILLRGGRNCNVLLAADMFGWLDIHYDKDLDKKGYHRISPLDYNS